MHVEQQQAARVVDAVLRGKTLDDALAGVDDRSPRKGRTLVQELAYGTLRHWGTLDAVARALADKPASDSLLHTLVAVALYQLDHTRAPPFAVVDRAVDAAASLARPQAKRWINAQLRRYLREKQALTAMALRDPVARWSYPRWWIRRVQGDFPDQWQSILTAGNARPPLTLRVNRRVSAQGDVIALFDHQGISSVPIGDDGIEVNPPRPVTSLPGYAEGAFSVQDAGAQLAAHLLDVSKGMRVLDACAAPGGKTTHLLELADIDVVALDRDASRLSRLDANLQRLRLASPRVSVLAADARTPERWWDALPFDRILVDVPCSASGVVRRHPDVKWLRRADDVASFVCDQRQLLDALWPLVARAGKLLYATCSVFRAENEAQIADFLDLHADALRETITLPAGVAHAGGQLLPSTFPAGHNQDGFFYALLRKA